MRQRLQEFLEHHEGLRIAPRGRSQAAVLVGFFEGIEGPELLLIRRADGEDRHARQVSFPGGHVEPGESPEEAAVRESAEECSLGRSQIEILGRHDDCVSIHEVVVSTIIAWIEGPLLLQREEAEVARIFSMPWSELVGGRGYSTRELRGYEIPYWTFLTRGMDGSEPLEQEETLWGLTGHMVRSLIQDLEGDMTCATP